MTKVEEGNGKRTDFIQKVWHLYRWIIAQCNHLEGGGGGGVTKGKCTQIIYVSWFKKNKKETIAFTWFVQYGTHINASKMKKRKRETIAFTWFLYYGTHINASKRKHKRTHIMGHISMSHSSAQCWGTGGEKKEASTLTSFVKKIMALIYMSHSTYIMAHIYYGTHILWHTYIMAHIYYGTYINESKHNAMMGRGQKGDTRALTYLK